MSLDPDTTALTEAVDACADELRQRIAQARERTADGLGRAREALEKAAHIAGEGLGRADQDQLAARLDAHHARIRAYRDEVGAQTRTQAGLAREAATHTRAIGDAAVQMGRAAHSSHLVAMNALIASARLGRDGAALAVLANEMQDLSQSVSTTSHAVHQLSDRLVDLLPRIERAVTGVATITDRFIDDLDARGEAVEEEARGLTERARALEALHTERRAHAAGLAAEGLQALGWGTPFEALLDTLSEATEAVAATVATDDVDEVDEAGALAA